VPQEVFFALVFYGSTPHGTVTFHEGFKKYIPVAIRSINLWYSAFNQIGAFPAKLSIKKIPLDLVLRVICIDIIISCAGVTMYSIGYFSKINKITPKTLRHYDRIGLLNPNVA
jgi:hypothetical protein